MKKLYLILTVIGFLAPNILVVQESLESGNFLLYTYPLDTMTAMFVNRISTIFAIDLLFAVIVFFIWSFYDSKKSGVQKLGLVWVLTLLFGLAGGFPLYLYLSEKELKSYA